MRVLVMGAGAVGCYYGGLLARAGHDVTFVARGAHLAALQERGLEVRSTAGTLRLHPVSAAAAPVGPVDLVLFTVKAYDTDGAATAVKPCVGPETAVLPLQNGVESVERLSRVLGGGRVLAGTATIVVDLVAPGVVEQRLTTPRIDLAEPSGAVTPRAKAIAAALRAAGADVVLATDARLILWRKFVILTPLATLTSVCRSPAGDIRRSAAAVDLCRRLHAETVAVGRAAGADLPDPEPDAPSLVEWVPPGFTSSMQRDFERGRRVELEQLTGAVVRLGRELGVPTPAFAPLYAVLQVRALAAGPPA